MITWIARLCALCAMSALMQMVLPKGDGRDGVRVICGLLMLKLTCESAVELIDGLAHCGDLSQMFSYLMM